ncbi:MAG: hemagglutinin repeat-containing protein, partial [Hydrogenophaga sp.]|uniref:hemagglutinin repeat-containing protein n=1 Tax=Hydrogenophaga sp. TaxID=1904254 RepID=UPI002ABCDCD2
MNRNHHRIVFNAARGQLMAVSECARSLGKASTCTVTTAAASLLFCLPLQAQISADPTAAGNLRATVLTAPNGVPLVNITTPSAAGVSRNVYQQFDVGTPGAILNNSRTDVQTQLGGWVQGNPWLATGPARVVLNEVNSSQPSQLNGFVELGGQRAEVIIANPAGINVNGGGFINASRATLTTGTPVMNAGALEGFRVQGGQVRVEGLGLDASTTDHAAILARAVKVNAGLWAQALTVVTGVNDVSANSAGITPLAPVSGVGSAPAFALDVAAIGGMYAGQIHLIGTEAGLGVNQGGLIDARGTLTLDVNGWLSQSAGARTYGDAVDINAQGVRNKDGAVIAARDALTIQAGEIHNTEGALLLSAGDMALSASERIENRSASIEALGSLSISTPVLINANDHLGHTVVSDATTNHTVFFTPGGAVDAADVAWRVVKPLDGFAQDEYDAYRREWLLPKSSAWADPAFKTYYLGPLPYVEAHVIWWDFGDSGYSQAVGDTFTFSRHSPVWAHFGMAAPAWDAPGQMPRAISDADTGWVQQPDPQAVTAWQAQAAPWVELTSRVASFKTAVEGQFLRFDAHSSYTQTTQRAVMTSSEPARISSGGAMTLNASHSLLNQDSEIVAGGVLSVTGASMTNQSTQVSAPTSRSGTFSSWGVTGRDCDLFGCDPEYGWIHMPYTETIANTVPLPALRFESASDAAPTPALGSALSALSTLNPDPASGPVFETDPRFIDQRQWLSSAYLLSALAVDPVTVHKRLGDGFIEQRLIREQVGTLTGQRFLGDFTHDEAQYLALMDAGATFAQAHQLRPGIALSAEQVAALTSDIVWLEAQTITLPDGSTTQALVPRVYLVPRAGDLSAGGSLIAGRDVQMILSDDALNSGTIAGRELVQIGAQSVVNTGLVSGQRIALGAREDLSNTGGTISATDALIVQAGRDLNVQTTTALGSGAAGVGRYRSEQVNRVAGLYVSNEAGVLLASAGRDVNLTAAVLQAGSVDVQAGRDLNLTSVNTSSSLDATRDARNFARVQQGAEVGTQIQGASVALQAGQDVTARAASVQAQGPLSVSAGRDLSLNAGESSYQIDHGVYAKSSGLLGSSSTETRTHNSRTDAVGTALGGAQVLIQSGRDITLTGSSAIADERIDITAGRDVSITAAQTRSGHSNLREEKTSGLFGSGGGITLGSQQQSTDQQTRGTGAAASTVGAIGGDVNVTAGRTYTQTGSDVLAPGGDISVSGQNIQIAEARTTERRTSEEKFKQSGISLSLSNPLIDALQGTASTAQALGNTGDGRTQALGLAVAALQAKQVVDAVQSIANNPAAAAGIGINISLGSSKSQSNSEVVREGAHGSTVVAAGDVNLIAGGAGSASNVRVQGSTIEAGDTVRIEAEGDISLIAATQTTRETNSQSSKSGSIGLGFNVGGAQTGISINASASRSKGQGTGEETTHSNTHVQAGQRVELESGADTTLRGAVVTAPNVQARIGGNLNIESLQDRATYSEKSESASAGVSLCIPPQCFGASSVNGGVGKTDIDSNYASVREQSAIRAGDGGFDVNPQGKSTLTGGAITSTQAAVDAGANRFDSQGGVELSDLHNQAAYRADGYSVNASLSGKLGDQSTAKTAEEKKSATAPTGPGGSAGIGSDKGSAASVTSAAISGIAGDTQARTGEAGTGIAPIFDRERVKDEVNAQVAITAAFGKNATKAVADFTQSQRESLKLEAWQAEQAGDVQRANQLRDDAARWDEGGAYHVGLQAITGALSGGASGALGAGAVAATAPVIESLTAHLPLPEPLQAVAGMVLSSALGAAAGGSAGAASGFNVDMNNRSLHTSERKTAIALAQASGGQYSVEEIEAQLRQMPNLLLAQSGAPALYPNMQDPATQQRWVAERQADPNLTIHTQGSSVIEVQGPASAELQAFIVSATTFTSGPLAGYSPYVMTPQAAQQVLNQAASQAWAERHSQPTHHGCASTECLLMGANVNLEH